MKAPDPFIGPLLPDVHPALWMRRQRLAGYLAVQIGESFINDCSWGWFDLSGYGPVRMEDLEEDPNSDPEQIVLVDYEGRRWLVEIEVTAAALKALPKPAEDDEDEPGDAAPAPGPGQGELDLEEQ